MVRTAWAMLLVAGVAWCASAASTGAASPERTLQHVVKAGDGWVKLDHGSDIVPGSALDFSAQGLQDAPAGKHGWLKAKGGHFEFEGLPGVEQRFYGVNLCFTANYPDHDLADRVVDRLVRCGYNSVRIHHHDGAWAKADGIDRLDYLIAKCIERGIYITTDLYVSRPVTWREIGIDRDGAMDKQLYKTYIGIYEPAFGNWCKFAKSFLSHVNPYTGRSYADEPGMPLISLVNEGRLCMGWEVKKNDERVIAAWCESGGVGDMPKPWKKGGVHPEEHRAFDEWINAKIWTKCSAYVRSLGAKALLTNDNNGLVHGEGEGLTPQYDYVDNHFYVDHPRFLEKKWRLPSQCENKNPILSGQPQIFQRGWAKGSAKPYTITEWNFAGPGRYRGMGGLLTGTLAAGQEWDGLWRFAYSHSSGLLNGGSDATPGYFDCVSDPLVAASDRASVCLYLRGDAVKTDNALRLDEKNGSLSIATPRTCGGFVETGLVEAGPLKFAVLTNSAAYRAVPTTLWVSSLDGKPIAQSSRMLLVHLTDVQGNGRKYADDSRTTLLEWGVGCVAEVGVVRVSLRIDNPRRYRVWALAANGARRFEVPCRPDGNALAFTASTRGRDGRGVIYYEVSALDSGAGELDLAGTWTLRMSDNPSVTCKAQVPGGIYAPLVKAGKVPHPYHAMNEIAAQWPAGKRWSFSRKFTLPGGGAHAKSVTLRLEDVDCFAAIKINGHEVGRTSNRFQRYDFDVKSVLRAGENEIEAVFEPTGEMSELEAMKYEPHEYPGAKKKKRQLQLVRTVRCHDGWDWGLTLMDTGLMGTVKLIASDIARIDYVYTTQNFARDYSSVDVTVTVELTAPSAGTTELAASLCGIMASRQVELKPGPNTASLTLHVENPKLWWPRGYGEPVLHDLVVTCAGNTIAKKIGLRTTELKTVPDAPAGASSKTAEVGKSLTVSVNGVDVFCQGANWIPCDAMENLQTPERYRDLLKSAADANMNMVRVWGGGQFEHDSFYDICDELGLLVWQDFMFACAIYPVTDYFMDGVKKELAHQLRRLRDHPSIALWCGDNECLHVANHEKDPVLLERYVGTCAVRERILSETVARFDPTRPFWPASPCKGPGDFRIIDQLSGDFHYWGIWFGLNPLRTSFDVLPRFVSEFGFQSHPSRELLEKYIPADRINPNSPDLHAHQKCPGTKPRRSGDETIQWFVNDTFRYPEGSDAFFYLSQVQQAMAIRYAIASWRPARARCSGMLIWQLNDNWPVTSWSTVEYGGKWKQAQYHAKRGFAPVAVFAATKRFDKNTLEVRAVNDTDATFDGKVSVDVWSFDGGRRNVAVLPVRLASHEGRTIKGIPLSGFGDESARIRSFVTLTLTGTDGRRDWRASDDWVFGKFRDVDLADAKIEAEISEDSVKGGTFRARLSVDRPAFYVWVNARNIRGEFDDNSFLLLPGLPKTVTFTPKDGGVTVDQFKKAFSIRHLRDSYSPKEMERTR